MMGISVAREEALLKAAKKLDIPPSKYKEAMDRFQLMRAYLQEGDYEGSTIEPEIYLQGSFKLGTEIRPFKNNRDADYDVDIVCCLNSKKERITARVIKYQIGDHLKASGKYKRMLEVEGKRCWTLNYAEQNGIGFHMDVLPSIYESWNLLREVDEVCNAIAVTNWDRKKDSYTWTTSNPKDFATWFYKKNKFIFDDLKQSQKQYLFEKSKQDGLFVTSDAVPNIHVKTPLQRAIQLLKRHRDIKFSQHKNEKYKPISIIITVLAARVYTNETSLYETLKNLVETINQHAQQMQSTFRFNEGLSKSEYALITKKADGTWFIPNPTNPSENFADRWYEDNHARAKSFFQWIAWANEEFVNTAETLDENYYEKSLLYPQSKNSGNTSKSLVFNAVHKEKPKWPMILDANVQISAKLKSNGVLQDFHSGDGLMKNYDLFFRATTNVLSPFSVYWQVVNTGEEARQKGGLRGGIFLSKTAGVGGLNQKEYTSYVGEHWVECFIVKNGHCVARSGEFVVRII